MIYCWSQEEISILLSNTHLDSEQLTKLLSDKTQLQIRSKSRSLGLNLPKSKRRQDNTINHNFFKQSNNITEYWKGFIAADGCIYTKGDTNSKFLSFGLHMQDEDHLVKFKEVTNSSHKISIRREKYRYLTIGSKEIFQDLVDCNITERKSLTLDNVIFNIDYSIDFIRGYFDGDGCLTFTEERNQVQLSMIGTENFLNRIATYFPHKPHICFERKGKTVFRLRFTKRLQVLDVLCWMYEKSTNLTRLTRKHNKALSYLKSKFVTQS